ncbi:metallophosphoesterase MPPED2-like [Sycon ciliatum]|uniref:metallophosphoesterase MPPED2-like n=1 Tax=Sycon ciliatum TaxID=27933 RepID=UPI0020ADD1D6|eukprot:scpid38954/ scgid29330/ Metallophosphoesterase domain-containing protein 1; Adult brain protein 239
MERLLGSSKKEPVGVRSPEDVWTSKPATTAMKMRGDPTTAWSVLQTVSPRTVVEKLADPSSPCPEGHTRFVCLSDTHGRSKRFQFEVPWGHVLLHAGDFTDVGQPSQVKEFNDYLAGLPHEHKIVIAGNHDLTFHSEQWDRFQAESRFTMHAPELKEAKSDGVKALLKDCTYIEDAEVIVRGFRIYGSPWQPEFCDWAFNLPRGDACLEKWQRIPSNTDILMTHGPPIGHGDLCSNGLRAGCVDLLREVQHRIKPKFHVFGHIHEAYGITTDGVTTYINASNCDLRYRPRQVPIVFDLPNPAESASE